MQEYVFVVVNVIVLFKSFYGVPFLCSFYNDVLMYIDEGTINL
jgi:hypothetical protein